MLAVNRDQHWPLTAWLAMIILRVPSPFAWHPAKGADTRWCDRPAVRGGLNPNGDRSSGGQQPEGLIPARISPPAHPALPLIFRPSHSYTCCRCRPGPLLPPRYHEDQKGLIAFWLQERSLRRSGTAAEQLQAAFGSRVVSSRPEASSPSASPWTMPSGCSVPVPATAHDVGRNFVDGASADFPLSRGRPLARQLA
jgi:hypothetical protein